MTTSLLKILSKSSYLLTVMIILMLLLLITQKICEAIVHPFFAPEIKTTTDQPRKELSDIEKKQHKIASAEKRFSPEGTLYLLSPRNLNRDFLPSPDMFQKPAEAICDIYDSSLNLLWSGKSFIDSPYQFIKTLGTFLTTDPFQYHKRLLKDKFIIPAGNSGYEVQEHWLYDYDKNFFTGYDRNKQIIGYFSTSGFADKTHRPNPLQSNCTYCTWTPVDSKKTLFVWQTEHRLYQIDFEVHAFNVLFEYDKAAINKVTFVRNDKFSDPTDNRQEFLTIQTTDNNVFLIQQNPSQVIQLQMPPQLLSQLYKAQWAYWKDRIYLQFEGTTGMPPKNTDQYRQWIEKHRNEPKQEWIELYRIEKDGNLNRLTRFEYIKPVEYKYELNPNKRGESPYLSYTTSIDPTIFYWLNIFKAMQMNYWSENSDEFYVFREFVNEFHPRQLWIAYPITICFMGLMLFHFWPRRTSWVKAGFWLGMIFLFNAAGFLTYLALNHFPVIRCHSCGKRRGLNRPDCPSCGAALPEPQSRPIDIIIPPCSPDIPHST